MIISTDPYILVVYSNSELYDNYRISAAFIGSNKSFYFQPRQKVLWNLNTSGSFKFLSLLWEEHKKETTKGIQQTMNGRKHTKQHDIIFYLMHSTTTKQVRQMLFSNLNWQYLQSILVCQPFNCNLHIFLLNCIFSCSKINRSVSKLSFNLEIVARKTVAY